MVHFIHYVFYPISASSHHCIDFASSYFVMFHWCLHYILSWFCILTFCHVSLMFALHSIMVLHFHIPSCFIDVYNTFLSWFATSHIPSYFISIVVVFYVYFVHAFVSLRFFNETVNLFCFVTFSPCTMVVVLMWEVCPPSWVIHRKRKRFNL